MSGPPLRNEVWFTPATMPSCPRGIARTQLIGSLLASHMMSDGHSFRCAHSSSAQILDVMETWATRNPRPRIRPGLHSFDGSGWEWGREEEMYIMTSVHP